MSAFVEMFGAKLRKGSELVDTETALNLKDKKAVAVYFSAHWCPPCRGFTPQLAEWYKKDLQAAGLEIVFASSDRDEKSFDDYYKDMPWLALPFDAKDAKAKLSQKCKVEGIPCLAIFDTEGKIVTTKGREEISEDPTGANLPWTPKPLKEILGTEFQNKEGKTVGLEAIEGKTLGIYFSAHWCPPCRGFTPKLTETYKTLKAANKDFEILFVSSDRDEASFDEYYKEMPWLALPYTNRKQKAALSKHFDVNGIPSLVILDKDLQVINASAVSRVRADEAGAEFPWEPLLVKPIDSDPEGIDEGASLVVLMEKTAKDEQTKIVEDILTPLAEAFRKEAKETGEDPKFTLFTACVEGDLANRVRGECSVPLEKVTDNKPQMLIMDIPDRGGYYAWEGSEVTAATVKSFLDDYTNKKLTRKQMGE